MFMFYSYKNHCFIVFLFFYCGFVVFWSCLLDCVRFYTGSTRYTPEHWQNANSPIRFTARIDATPAYKMVVKTRFLLKFRKTKLCQVGIYLFTVVCFFSFLGLISEAMLLAGNFLRMSVRNGQKRFRNRFQNEKRHKWEQPPSSE